MKLRHKFDEYVDRTVRVENEYGLPETMTGKVVLDVGGNIGAFAVACLSRGAKVLAVEPAADNCRVFDENTAEYEEGVHLLRGALTCDGRPVMLYGDEDPAGNNVLVGHGRTALGEVESFTLNRLVQTAFNLHRRLDLVKIDAEGVEYEVIEDPGFENAVLRVPELAVEFHGGYVDSFRERSQACREKLLRCGFKELSWQATHPQLGWYRLYRGRRAVPTRP